MCLCAKQTGVCLCEYMCVKEAAFQVVTTTSARVSLCHPPVVCDLVHDVLLELLSVLKALLFDSKLLLQLDEYCWVLIARQRLTHTGGQHLQNNAQKQQKQGQP